MRWSYLLVLGVCLMVTNPTEAKADSFKEALVAGQNKLAAERFDDARKDYARALSLAATDPQKLQTQFLIGLSYAAEGDPAQARKAFSKIINTPNVSAFFRIQAHTFIAVSYSGERKTAETRTEYGKILGDKDATPHDKASAQLGIAMSYFDDKAFEKAREEFDKHSKLPGVEPVLAGMSQVYIGRAYLEELNFMKAREEFLKVLSTRTGDTNPRFELAGQRNQQEAQRGIAKSYILQAQDEYSKLLQTKNLNAEIEAEAQKNLASLKAITEPEATAKPEAKKEPSPGDAGGK